MSFYLITFTTFTWTYLSIILFTDAIGTYADDFTTVLHMTLFREGNKIAIVTKALFRKLRTGRAGEDLADLSPNPYCVAIIHTVIRTLT